MDFYAPLGLPPRESSGYTSLRPGARTPANHVPMERRGFTVDGWVTRRPRHDDRDAGAVLLQPLANRAEDRGDNAGELAGFLVAADSPARTDEDEQDRSEGFGQPVRNPQSWPPGADSQASFGF